MPVTVSVAEVFAVKDAFMGFTRGSMGETSAFLLLLGGIYLLWKRVISWHIPLSILVSILVVAYLFNVIDPERYEPPLMHILSGGMILGAFFIATDPVTSPNDPKGQILFGIGIGLVAYIIRTWGTFPEAVGFAVLFMNALTLIIDRYMRPRIYGYNLQGQPLKAGEE